jgi:hypothetical protein
MLPNCSGRSEQNQQNSAPLSVPAGTQTHAALTRATARRKVLSRRDFSTAVSPG